jgi:hypothetical protein
MSTGLPNDPLRGSKRASRKTFAAPCGVAQSDGISGGIEPNFVRAGVLTSAIGTYINNT